jgi:hypothetical protein
MVVAPRIFCGVRFPKPIASRVFSRCRKVDYTGNGLHDYSSTPTRAGAVSAIAAAAGAELGYSPSTDWHRHDHGERCFCLEGEQFGAQSTASVDALAAEGKTFDGYSGSDRGPLGPPGETPSI